MLKYLVELNVSNTSIVELPNSIVNLKSLKVLNFDGSCMQKLPDIIEKMEKLEEIYGVSRRQHESTFDVNWEVLHFRMWKSTQTHVENVPKLPQSLAATRLKILYLSNCRMLKETPDFSAFLSLEKLVLKRCAMLTKFSDSIGMLKHLVELDVSFTSIVELPNSIVNLKSLKALWVNGTSIQKLPDCIGMMEKLEDIYGVGCRQLEVIPSDIVGLPSLQILKLTETRVENVPKLLQSLILKLTETCVENVPKLLQSLVAARLKILDLSDCRMLKETPVLSAFLSLEKLILKECKMLTKLSDSIGMLKYLVELDVSHTSIVELPNSIVNLKSLKVLKINGCCMQKLPDCIGMMEKLKEIYGEGCRQVEVISSDIVGLPCLQILKLTKTRVENVPKLLQSLVATRLKVLDLSDCRMLKETSELFAFLSLEKLNLKGCTMLTKLCDSIGMLKYLVKLDVSHTSIEELPNSIVNLKNLKVLKIDGSFIQKLPDAIGMMEKLEKIYGEGCRQLEMIPSDIVRLPSLQILKLTETRVENVPKLPQSLVCLCLSSTVSKKDPEISNLVNLRNLELCFPLTYTVRPMIPKSDLCMSRSYCKLELSIITRRSSYLGYFRCLKELELENCDNLRCVGQLPSDLRIFIVTNCRFLEVVDLSNLSNFKNLKGLEVRDCLRLVEIRGLDRLESLKSLYIECCSPLLRLPDLSTWKELRKWDVDALATNLARGKQVARSVDLPL
ncbi:disease resistance protein RPV1 isoform X5 [Eucalyptus grandis]|uniref:disease resistance protein RPV1 isoform X5 n=1 Tax=Eucalyptus grandis TaxID=71139 RepID=UPI00192EB4BD|nr:disease resistance protein RPV1 isoform X5 [Eucalyptus grandis]